jgi:diguanylate cyclase (GGDEF)-like protein
MLMHRFSSGRRAQILIQLVAAAIVALIVFYAVASLIGSKVVLALIFAAVVFFSLSWMYARMRRQKDEYLRYHATHDSTTDLPCRSLFAERVEGALERADEGSDPIAVMFIDLDDFKEINHSLGYESGDKLLISVAERLGSSLRPGDTIGRLGGDEFTVLLEDVPDKGTATAVAKRIGEKLEAPFKLEESEVLVSASIGIAITNDSSSSTSESLLREANVAMQGAKKKGKSRYRMFDPSAETPTGGRLVQEAEMRRAIQDKEFRVHYQPLVSLASGRICGVEALVRWQHPLYGLIPPGEFIPLAEQTGLIEHLGRWVLKEACRQVRLWQEEQESALTLSVNISACQFQQPNLVKEIHRTLKETGLASNDLKLEITESIMMHDASAISALRELKEIGIRIAMDDFGTGYSSLSYLKRFPIDTLKIDRSYVDGLGSDAGDTAIVHATIAFAKALNLSVTAEGIENAGQLACLRELGCELGQGYHFAKPLPSEKARELLVSGLQQPSRSGHFNQA